MRVAEAGQLTRQKVSERRASEIKSIGKGGFMVIVVAIDRETRVNGPIG